MASILEGVFNEIEQEYNDFNESEDFLDEIEPVEDELEQDNDLDEIDPEMDLGNIDLEVSELEPDIDFDGYDDIDFDDYPDVETEPQTEINFDDLKAAIFNTDGEDEFEEDVIIDPDVEVDGVEDEELIINDEEDEEDEYFDFGKNEIEQIEEDEEEPSFEEEPPMTPEEVDEPKEEKPDVKKPSEFTFTELKEFVENLTETEASELTNILTEEKVEIEENYIEGEKDAIDYFSSRGIDVDLLRSFGPEGLIRFHKEELNNDVVDEATSEDLPDSIKKENEITDDSDISAIMSDSVDYHLIGRNVSDISRSKSIANKLTNPLVLGVVLTTPGVYFIKDDKKIPLNTLKGKGINIKDDSENIRKLTGTPSKTNNVSSVYVTDTTDSSTDTNIVNFDNGDSNITKYSIVYGNPVKEYPIMLNRTFDDVWEDEILGVVLKSDENDGRKEYVSYEDSGSIHMTTVEDFMKHYTEISPTDYYDVYLIINNNGNKEVEEVEEVEDENIEESINESIDSNILINLDEAILSNIKLTKSLEDKIIMKAAELLIAQMK